MSALPGEVRLEIERLHDFFVGWFQGIIVKTAFEDQVTARLHPEFENIQPSGRALPRDILLTGLHNAWGSNPDFRIEIRDTRIMGAWPDCGLILAGYVEAQFGARNTNPPDNLRRSTVLFERSASGLVWRYIQETAMPA
ncbi:MAG TPA: hypothetical protein VMY41_11115 [Thermohalobaculum sp.]|nr:hypothetical protein [Thermohalobaculum sp.]